MTHLLFCVSRAIQRRLDELQIAWLGDQQAEPVHFVFEKFVFFQKMEVYVIFWLEILGIPKGLESGFWRKTGSFLTENLKFFFKKDGTSFDV